MPTISVIVPIYKVEPYLHRCIDSILAQTYTDFELILVDDGSPDNCGNICDEYAKKDSRIRVIHQENGGLSAARNAGIDWAFANSNSQWLTFIHSDDWVHLEYLEILYVAAVQNRVHVTICGYIETDGDISRQELLHQKAAVYSPEDFWLQNRVNATTAWGKLYHKAYFETIRYPLGRLHEDEFTTYKILFAEDEVAVVAEPLYYYYQNPAGIMKSEWNPKRLDVFDAFEMQAEFFSKIRSPVLREYTIRECGRTLMTQHKLYRSALNYNYRITHEFSQKARHFLKNYHMYYDNDMETKVNIFWIGHPLLSKIYHRIKK